MKVKDFDSYLMYSMHALQFHHYFGEFSKKKKGGGKSSKNGSFEEKNVPIFSCKFERGEEGESEQC